MKWLNKNKSVLLLCLSGTLLHAHIHAGAADDLVDNKVALLNAPAKDSERADDALYARSSLPIESVLQQVTGGLAEQERDRLLRFYSQRNYQPAWFRAAELAPHARIWLETVSAADKQGLNAQDYFLAQLLQYWYDQQDTQKARLEILLTRSFLRYSQHVRHGRYQPDELDNAWHIRVPQSDPVELLDQALKAPSFRYAISQLAPSHKGYQQLKQALQQYRQIAADGGWAALPGGPTLEPGMRDPRVQSLRQRLEKSGDLSPNPMLADTTVYDDELALAVRRFQERHGLRVDGKVGRRTLAALNASVEERIAQIQSSMERWRWLPQDLGERYLLVDMTNFTVQAIEQGQVALQLRAIIGKPKRETPVFREDLRYLELNPYWNVPTRIAQEDLVPKQMADPQFFQRMGIRVFSDWSPNAVELDPATIDWTQYTQYFPFKLRQDPGPRNSLGQIKFMMPNQYAIYLHDTPSKSLFERHTRTFSSGCIRVEEPMKLARYVLGIDSHSEMHYLQQQLSSAEPARVSLTKPLPVYLVYWTARADQTGEVHFRHDIYGRDRDLQEAMASNNLGQIAEM